MARRKRTTPFAPVARMVAGTVSIPAPIAGLNVRDSLAAMDQRFAPYMQDMFPTAWGVQVRKGWRIHCNMPEAVPVRSLLNYAAADGSEKLFAVTSVAGGTGKLYDVTASSDTPPLIRTTLSPYVQSTNFANVFGDFVLCADGADTPFYYDGTTWADLALTGEIIPPVNPDPGLALDPKNLIDVNIFKRRVWWVEKNSTRAWYGGTDEIQGTLSLFDLGEVFPRGGYLIDIGTWTIDTGTGINDNIIFFSSEGDIAMFGGIDPDTDFTLLGIYKIAKPINRRSCVKRGGDLIIATDEGIVSMSQIMQEQSELPSSTITDVIKPLLSQIASSAIVVNDWCLVTNNKNEHLIYNTRDSRGTTRQYVMNLTTKAWTQYSNMDAYSWAELESEPYFGGVGYVARFWIGAFDFVSRDGSVTGELIQGKCIQAFNYFDSPGKQKFFNMARPIVRSSSEPSIGVSLAVDYNASSPVYADDPAQLNYPVGIWDVSLWDEALWATGEVAWRRWFNVGAIGMAAAVAIAIKCNTESPNWISTDLTLESGGVL